MPDRTDFDRRRLRVMLVDDHPIVREGLRRRIEAQPDMDVCCEAESAAEALIVTHEGTTPRVVNIERTSVPIAGNDMLQISVPFGAPDGMQFIECERGGAPVFYVMGDGRVIGGAGAYFDDNVELGDGGKGLPTLP